MSTFVNYYPCSYGDSLINMFSAQNKSRTNNLVILDSTDLFKQPEFYERDLQEQHKMLSELDPAVIYGCHRQHGFDFGSSHRVVSIDLDYIDFLPNRIKSVHLAQMKEILLASKFSKLDHKDKIKFEYRIWAKNNIFDTDVRLPFSLLFDAKGMRDFCHQHNFNFDQNLVNEIVKDLQQYL